MTAILIEPIQVTTRGGYNGEIIGISPTNTDVLVGWIDTPAFGRVRVRWNAYGVCRDNHPDCNIEMHEGGEAADAVHTATGLASGMAN